MEIAGESQRIHQVFGCCAWLKLTAASGIAAVVIPSVASIDPGSACAVVDVENDIV